MTVSENLAPSYFIILLLFQRIVARQRPRLFPGLRHQRRRPRWLPRRLRAPQGHLDATQQILGAPRGGGSRPLLQSADRPGRGAGDGHRVACAPLLAKDAHLLPGTRFSFEFMKTEDKLFHWLMWL